jgi:hypothetical protein
LHARFTSLSEDEFAAVSSQEAEAEDEALRINAAAAAAGTAAASAGGAGGLPSVPEQGESTPNTPRPSLQRVGSEVFGRSPTPPPPSSFSSRGGCAVPSSAALSDDEEEGDELLEQLGSVSNAGVPLPHLSPLQQGHAARSPAARTLFPSAVQQQRQQQQQSQPRWPTAASSSSSSSSVLGMDNHAYGFSLVCIYKLSLLFASLPLAAAAAVMEGGGGSFAGSNPREVLHKDLLLLASHELTPEQKLRWIAHMMRHHSDWLV